MKSKISIILLLTLLSTCITKSKTKSRVKIDYVVYSDIDKACVKKFLSRIYIYSLDTIVVLESWKTPDDKLLEESKSVFSFEHPILFKILSKKKSIPYLSVNQGSCITSTSNNSFASWLNCSYCFTTKIDLKIGGTIYKDLYKFSKTCGETDGVSSHLYLNKNMQILKEEYASGMTDYFNIEATSIKTIDHGAEVTSVPVEPKE